MEETLKAVASGEGIRLPQVMMSHEQLGLVEEFNICKANSGHPRYLMKMKRFPASLWFAIWGFLLTVIYIRMIIVSMLLLRLQGPLTFFIILS